MRISDWSSDVCSSDLLGKELREDVRLVRRQQAKRARMVAGLVERDQIDRVVVIELVDFPAGVLNRKVPSEQIDEQALPVLEHGFERTAIARSEEHTSELQSLMRSSYAVFCLKKTNNT